ncbi:Hypothetical protein CM240_1859 [Clostridium bornimense]|uniref:histidine kinase n=2 Tax=Clostridium bornimense TaxID=1216932 RepID=W6S3X4_9CLOT|nr:Hypothetical protein CM240_1859 [Clostridium bornimense]
MIFNSNSFAYKTPVVSIGINEHFTLSEKENEYITGVFEIEDNLKYLNMLIDINPELSNLIIVSDKSKYSSIIKENINSVSYLTSKPIEISFIEEEYLDNVLINLKKVASPQSAILIMGDFKSSDENIISDLSVIIDSIKSITDAPIYTKVPSYLYAGAVGGVMKFGENHGYIAGEIISKLLLGENIKNLNSIHNSLYLTVFNYDALNYYNINPLLLPKGSLYINKNKFDLLLPRPLKYLTWSTLIIITLVFIFTIFKYIRDKKTATLNKILLNQALENDRLKTNFITTISHELRTPLNIILSTTKLISLSIKKSIIDKEYLLLKLDYIENNSNRLLKLINNIIDITKIESGFLTPNFAMDNIVEVVENTTLSIIDLAKEHNVNIIFDTEEEEIMMSIDRIMIERIILNLISNSIKFTKSLGTIYVSINKKNDNVIISVEDNGIGIPNDEIDNVFHRFHQVDSSLSRHNEGSGLGLFIVNSLVNLHYGKIEVFSIENIGTKFDITLPIFITNVTNDDNITIQPLEQLIKVEMSDLKEK